MLLRNFPSLSGSRHRFFLSRCKFSALTSTPDCTAVDSKPCVRNCSREREGLYNGNVQQNPLCAASCVTSSKDIPVSPRFSPTFFYPDANSVLLRAHLCSAVDSKPCVRNCVCVCVFSSHSFWTSIDVPAGVTQEEDNTGFSIHLLSAVLALIFLARRIQPFLSLVDREVEF